MNMIKQTIENLYTYDESEFMPVFEGEKLLNKSAFVRYKIKSLIEKSEAKRVFADFIDALDVAIKQ